MIINNLKQPERGGGEEEEEAAVAQRWESNNKYDGREGERRVGLEGKLTLIVVVVAVQCPPFFFSFLLFLLLLFIIPQASLTHTRARAHTPREEESNTRQLVKAT